MTDKDQNNDMRNLVKRSNIYQEYCLKRDQILRYKWIESEKIGQDIGLDKAWIQWEAKALPKMEEGPAAPKP